MSLAFRLKAVTMPLLRLTFLRVLSVFLWVLLGCLFRCLKNKHNQTHTPFTGGEREEEGKSCPRSRDKRKMDSEQLDENDMQQLGENDVLSTKWLEEDMTALLQRMESWKRPLPFPIALVWMKVRSRIQV